MISCGKIFLVSLTNFIEFLSAVSKTFPSILMSEELPVTIAPSPVTFTELSTKSILLPVNLTPTPVTFLIVFPLTMEFSPAPMAALVSFKLES